MRKKEFLNEVSKLEVRKVKGKVKDENNHKFLQYFIDNKRSDIYGYYKDTTKEYVVIYKSIERFVVKEIGRYITEEEAMDKLLYELKNVVEV